MMEFCDINSTDDITGDLKKTVIKKAAKDLEVLVQLIKRCTSPFASELSEDHLYNISKGQLVNDEMNEFLRSVKELRGRKTTYEYYWFDGPQSPFFEKVSAEFQEPDVVSDETDISEGDEDDDNDVINIEEDEESINEYNDDEEFSL
ncbi:hypothetical protein PV325_004051 [Microctonus aethiopoides]|nr:hypothetical protein PV325_004051 [Microctonus aethiopoides]